MNHAGFKFRMVKGPSLFNGPGIYIYMHQASGKCFVRAMRNVRAQRGKNNYPNYLKELLKTNPSEVILFLADLPDDSKEVLFHASRAVVTSLSEKGVLYKRPKPNRGGIYRHLPGEGSNLFTIWVMTHIVTGAVFYFEEIKGLDVTARVSQRMLTFNNYVMKDIPNENRVMYYFAKKHFPLDISKWIIRDLDLTFSSEQEALLHITKLSKQHLDSDEVVLNRISSNDALYYRNSMLRKEHKSIEEYLKYEEEEV